MTLTSCIGRLPLKQLCGVVALCSLIMSLHTMYGFNKLKIGYRRPLPVTANTTTAAPSSTQRVIEKNLYHTDGLDLWLNSALLDERENRTVVHVLGTARRDVIHGEFSCIWRYSGDAEGRTTMEVPASRRLVDKHWPDWGPIFAHIFTCRLPHNVRPTKVALVSRDRRTHFHEMLINVGTTLTPRRFLAVCIKPATGPLSVVRLVEWFETLQAAGIKHVVMYHTDVVGNAIFVLEYYQKLGLLEIVSFPYLRAVLERVDTEDAHLSGQDRYAVYQQVYLVAMQDCLHRFRPTYEYILFIDLDEILLPSSNYTIDSMLRALIQERNYSAGFLFFTSWHFEEFGEEQGDKEVGKLYMQKYSESTPVLNNQPKCIASTDRTDTVNFHTVVTSFDNKYPTNAIVPWQKFGYLHHFRGRCDTKFAMKRCKDDLLKTHRRDPCLLRYRGDVIAGVNRVLDILQVH